MTKTNPSGIQRGQAITFRVPSDTPDHILRQLQKLKETERRNFSSKVAEFVLEGVSNSYTREKEAITIPLPKQLTKSQRDWLKHAHSEAMLGSILHHLLTDPLRATSLLASLNSNALEIDQALYLQETTPLVPDKRDEHTADSTDETDDLDNFTWESAKEEPPVEEEEQEETLDDLLGDFLAQMNK